MNSYDEERIDKIGQDGATGEHYVREILASLSGKVVTVVSGDGMIGVIDQETEDLYVLYKD